MKYIVEERQTTITRTLVEAENEDDALDRRYNDVRERSSQTIETLNVELVTNLVKASEVPAVK